MLQHMCMLVIIIEQLFWF